MRVKTDADKQFDTPNIHSTMNEREKIVRAALFDKIIEANRPVFPDEIEEKDKKSIIKTLAEKDLVVFREDGAITGAYPVSALPTRHKVQLKDGRSFYAMCAIDSLGIAYDFDQDILISSSCRKCDTPVSIEIKGGRISQLTPSTTYALHVDIRKYKDWASTC
ncbi:hypothetical protein GOV08_00905 [Candidatus Woesearchaeota archaeon]|nr:hypothetical protein [Candidatus Woesearchaeota archaeon]